jgi:molybdate transport system regulatory protein
LRINLDFIKIMYVAKQILKRNFSLSVNGRIWIECGGKKYFDQESFELLKVIGETGSINKSSKKIPIAYKKAWDIINNLNANSSRSLVKTYIGGINGGGSIITKEAMELMIYYEGLCNKFRVFLTKETTKIV